MSERGIGPELPPAMANGAATAARASERQMEAHRRAWALEMERAQMASWLVNDPLKQGLPPLERAFLSPAAARPSAPAPQDHDSPWDASGTAPPQEAAGHDASHGATARPPMAPPAGARNPAGGTGLSHDGPPPAAGEDAQAAHPVASGRPVGQAHAGAGQGAQPGQGAADARAATRRLATALQVFGDVAASTSGPGPAPADPEAVPEGSASDAQGAPQAPGEQLAHAATASAAARQHAGPVLASLAQRLSGIEFVPSGPLAGAGGGAAGVPAGPAADAAGEALPAGEAEDAAAATPSGPAPARRADAGPAPSIRLHADWSADGVRLWLALDANVLDHMDAIAQQVRQWVRAQGVKMLALSCNGRLLSEDDASAGPAAAEFPSIDFPKENAPWPSAQ